MADHRAKTLSARVIAMLIVLAAIGYWIAFSIPIAAPAIFASLISLCVLSRVTTARRAFYVGLIAGIAMYAPHLWFFLEIFGWRAPLIWLITGWPIGAFVLLLFLVRRRFHETWVCILTPFFWTGIEFFRSELYPLRFAWMLPGEVVAFLPGVGWTCLGVYGIGFIYIASAAFVVSTQKRLRFAGAAITIVAVVFMYLPSRQPETTGLLHVAGVQLENPGIQQVADALDRLAVAHPEAQILVLSEYTFHGPVPDLVRRVLQKHQRYLIAGGMHFLPGDDFYDTAFVVGPDGQDVFEQGKSVPVQFMDDGLPAPSRRVWESPWGKIGTGICYDVSYALVCDDFVRQGAQGLIFPTMDLASWGDHERRMLHGALAPIRSAEYGVPVFSVWSSGVSQLTGQHGKTIATAGYPGQGEMIAGRFDLSQVGHLPPDRWLAWAAVVITGQLVLFFAIQSLGARLRRPVSADFVVAK
ncbi:MAG TPA: nitrilase-related carbon-nitrogen hydrolase [Tepidisphaeraceae bacterium]|nr:nitrilase-related carbon-nitrogen hydrolase [Tepidisphaeraceae bacterium]